MLVKKNFSARSILLFSGAHLVWLSLWAFFVAFLYKFSQLKNISIPWLPFSLIGTAVAFYVGFKNNNAYGRLWEARKIWGAIVNDSRSWAAGVVGFINNNLSEKKLTEEELDAIKKRLVYSHIGWLYSLRKQLLIPTPWEHINQNRLVRMTTKKRLRNRGVGLYDKEVEESEVSNYLPKEDYDTLINSKNTATQIIANQAEFIAELRSKNIINDFRHIELQELLNNFYTHQGKCERIKKFPLPRQYSSMSFTFIAIFSFILPFGMVSEFSKIGEYGVWLSIPFTVVVGWVYLMMELIGDYSENPFEGLSNDIPMLSLCRTIEIDLREMLGETELPDPIESKNYVLM